MRSPYPQAKDHADGSRTYSDLQDDEPPLPRVRAGWDERTGRHVRCNRRTELALAILWLWVPVADSHPVSTGQRLGKAARRTTKKAAVPEPTRRRPRGGVDEYKPGRWRARTPPIAGERRKVPGGPWDTREQAEDALDRYLGLVDQGRDPDKAQRPFSQAYEHLLTTVRGEDNTIIDRRRFANRIIYGTASTTQPDDVLGHWPVRSLTVSVIRDWVQGLEQSGVAAGTIRKWFWMVHQTLDHAVVEGYIEKNPIGDKSARKAVRLPEVNKKAHHLLTLEELVTMTFAATPEDALLWEVLMWSGQRSQEVRAITPLALVNPGDLSLEEATTQDATDRKKTIKKKTKSRAGDRPVAIPMPLWEALARLAEGKRHDEPLFSNADGTLLSDSWYQQQHQRMRKRAGLTGNPADPMPGRRRHPTGHDHRATFASYLAAANIPLAVAMVQLGHAQSTMTIDVYTSVARWLSTDPAFVEARKEGMDIHALLDHLYAEAWKRADTVAAQWQNPLEGPVWKGGRPRKKKPENA